MNKPIMRPTMLLIATVAALSGGAIAGKAYADQPYMHDALGQLLTARATLAAGASDKGGHRVRAIADVDRAISEVKAAIAYAR